MCIRYRSSKPFFDYDEVLYYPVRSNPLKAYPVNHFIEDIKRYANEAYRLIFYHDDEEVLEFKKLVATGLKCVYQTTPEEPAEDVSGLFK